MTAVRVPVPALYIDYLRYDEPTTGAISLINTVPDNNETDVSQSTSIKLQLVSTAPAVDIATDVHIYVTRSSDGLPLHAYDESGIGVGAGFTATALRRASPGSSTSNEFVITLIPPAPFSSLEIITVEVRTRLVGAAEYTVFTYSFVVEDLTAPSISELLWLNPRRALVKFDEEVATTDVPGGSCFIKYFSGNLEIISSSQVRILGETLSSAWIGYFFQMAGSINPVNNRRRTVLAVDTGSRLVTLSDPTMEPDTGIDTNEAGIVVERRTLSASISPYYLAANLTAEGISDPANSATRIQCAYTPIPISAAVPEIEDLPAGENPNQYIFLDFHTDISFGRKYTFNFLGVDDVWENRQAVLQSLAFTSPMFGIPANRLSLWSQPLIPVPDMEEDLANDGQLRKMAVVIQDIMNLVQYYTEELQYLYDPYRCPEHLLDQLLYHLGNPFRFSLPTTRIKRRLAFALQQGAYPIVGTVKGIEYLLRMLLDYNFEVNVFVTAQGWVLGGVLDSNGNSHYGTLGVDTALAPSTAYMNNCYEVRSPIDLTDEQRRMIREIATWADPPDMHLVAIIEPSTSSDTGLHYWVLGTSALGLTTILQG